MIKIRWCGHSYFILEDVDFKIAIDPHDGGSIGMSTCYDKADLILVTHDHYDHNAVDVASTRNSIVIKWREGLHRVGKINVEGYKFYHDKAYGKLRGETIAYKIRINDLTIAHLGDLGHPLSEDDIAKLAPIDILMIPVGGVYTIDHHEAWTITGSLKPRIVIPMHYWIPGTLLPLNPLDKFLDINKTHITRIKTRELEISKNSLPDKITVVVYP